MDHHLSHNRSTPSRGALHRREAGLLIKIVDELDRRLCLLALLHADSFNQDDRQILVPREGDLWLEQRVENLPGHHLALSQFYRLQVPQPQVIKGTQLIEVPRIAQSLVLQRPQFALVGPWHSAGPTAGYEGFQGADGLREFDRLQLGHRLHFGYLPITNEDRRLSVLVGQPGDVEGEQVVEGRSWILR